LEYNTSRSVWQFGRNRPSIKGKARKWRVRHSSSDEDDDTRFGAMLFSILEACTVALNQATMHDSSIRVQLELRVESRVATLTLTESRGERAHVCVMVVTLTVQ
jgi:hypothetical protein